jgi:hypothetical protein
MRIETKNITNWGTGKKTRPIKAKPLLNLLVDRSVTSKFLLDTLEGNEPLGDGAVVCVGEAGDAWQQMPKKLLAKYDVTAIDTDGWTVCTPKPDNVVNVVEVNASQCAVDGKFTIIGLWGATVDGEKNVQKGEAGDFICQNQTDLSDVWIVKRKLFLNTYNIIS